MARSIDTQIAKVRNAVYGKDVREAIAASMEQTYDACETFKKAAAASAEQAAAALPLDTTLSLSGKAADAGTVGEKLSDLKSDLTSIKGIYIPSDISNDLSFGFKNNLNDEIQASTESLCGTFNFTKSIRIYGPDGWKVRALYADINDPYSTDSYLYSNEDVCIVLIPPARTDKSYTKEEILSHYRYEEFTDYETFDYFHPQTVYRGARWVSQSTTEASRRNFTYTFDNQKVWCDKGYKIWVIQNGANVTGWVDAVIIDGEATVNVKNDSIGTSLTDFDVKNHVYIEKIYPYTRNERELSNSENASGEIEGLYSGLEKVLYSDDGATSWSSDITETIPPTVIKNRGLIIKVDDQLKSRVMIYDKNPADGDATLVSRQDWTTDRTTQIPPNTYFVANFRNSSNDNTITIDFVREHSVIEYYDIYSNGYIDSAIESFERRVLPELSNYPIVFGVITDVHYPTKEDYVYKVYRQFIENGCSALKRIASDFNMPFIINCGDDAGYSSDDGQVPNIIYSMTKIASCLRGGVPVMMINGNHEAFQNNSDIDGTDIYRSRIINQENCVSVSDKATNFYLDDEYFKIRYVFFDTECRTDYTHSEAETDLVKMFSTAPSDYTFVLFSHRDITDNPNFANATNFIGSISDYVSRIAFHITGHMHSDGYYENAGIKNINFIAGGCFNYSGMTSPVTAYGNTDKESSFAVVGYNPSAKKIKVFGYGMATDREFTVN